MGDGSNAELRFVKELPPLVPDRTGPDLGNTPGLDELLKVLPRVGEHLLVQFTKLGQKGLTVKGGEPQLVEHEVVGRRVREAEEGLLVSLYRGGKLTAAEEIRQQTVGIVPADGGHDEVDLRIAEGLAESSSCFTKRSPRIPAERLTMQTVLILLIPSFPASPCGR